MLVFQGVKYTGFDVGILRSFGFARFLKRKKKSTKTKFDYKQILKNGVYNKSNFYSASAFYYTQQKLQKKKKKRYSTFIPKQF